MSILHNLQNFLENPVTGEWKKLPFFQDGSAQRICEELDRRAAAGAEILPPPACIFNAFTLTPFSEVKVVILGQDPYPTPGDAHGLAFSYIGSRRIPASLKTILDEVGSDFRGEEKPERPSTGDLTPWAKQGVLLLNSALTVEAKAAGAHLKLGWAALTDQVIEKLSSEREAIVFLLWGGPARAKASLIDTRKHLVVESGHPSPLNRLRDFRKSRPFTKTNNWLQKHGLTPINWTI
ncbi:uracil-DNA glycosylase [Hohaiivirga grylli]